jgi:tripartite-type tricarboxylate transporter receptor subunit TctC
MGLLICAHLGCSTEEEYPYRPITLVCPWSVGGGTDRVSRQMAFFLEHELGVPVNVINATGGRGVTGHSRGLQARPDGYTIAMMTVELNMLHHQDLTTITWQDAEPLMSINEDAAAIFVQNTAYWTNANELLEHIRQHPGELTASGTAIGGIWHLALAGWLQSAGVNPNDIKWIPMNGAAPSLQELASGGIHIVCCSLPEADILTKSGQVRCLGVMAEEKVPGYEDVSTLKVQGLDWVMVGWRGLAVPKGTPPERVEKLVGVIERIVTGNIRVENKSFPDFMAAEGFNNKWRRPNEFRDFLAENDEKFGKLLNSDAFANISTGTIGPMLFPRLLFGLMGIFLAALGIRSVLSRNTNGIVWLKQSLKHDSLEPTKRHSEPTNGILNAILVVGTVVVYPFLAETVGFVLLVGVLLLVLLLRLGSRFTTSVVVTVLFTPAVYHIFVHLLRVPLPRGFLGW